MLSYQALPPQLLPEAEGRHPQDPRDGIDYGRAVIKEENSLQLSASRQLRGPRSKGPQDPEPAEAAETTVRPVSSLGWQADSPR